MNTLELETCLKQNKCTKKYFKGVFAADDLPLTPLSRKSIIIANTAISSHPGLHWTCFVVTPRKVEFFDSGGASYFRNKYFKKFVKINSNNKIVTFNKKAIQSKHSNICGQYCALYALFRANSKLATSFTSKFSTRTKIKNDMLALKMFNCSFKSSRINIKKCNKNRCIQYCTICCN